MIRQGPGLYHLRAKEAEMSGILMGLLVSQNLFARTYGGISSEGAYSIIQTSDGGYAITGYGNSFGAGYYDFLILKLSSTGAVDWARTFGGAGGDGAYSIIQTSDGGYAVTGYTYSFGAGSTDLLFVKFSSGGTPLWSRAFGGTSSDYAWPITQTSDGGYAIAGGTTSFGAGGCDFLVLKLTSTGILQWVRTFGGVNDDYAYSMTQTTDGGYTIAGRTDSFGAGGWDFLVLNLDSSGNLTWARTFGGTDWDYGYSIAQTLDGGYAVAGWTASFTVGSSDFLILKLSSTGAVDWVRTFGGAGGDGAYSIIQTSDGGYAVTGYTYSFGAGSSDFLILKLSSTGDLEWAKTFGELHPEYSNSITQNTDGGYAVAGVQNFGVGSEDFLVLKLGPDGNYPGCVDTCTPTVTNPSPSTSSPTGLASCSPDTSSPVVTVDTPYITITDVCPPAVEERGAVIKPGVICSPIPRGALFVSPFDVPLRIYAVDGRLVCSGELIKGENRISLDRGVYFWRAGTGACPYEGKAVIR